MYTLYTTRALILATHDRGEGDRVFDLLTEDLGLVRAHAKSVRAVSSKLRFGLQRYSLTHVDLVRGREYWRVVGSDPIESMPTNLAPHVMETFIRASGLLRKLIHGEEPHPALFRDIMTAYTFAKQNTIAEEYLRPFESLLVLRLLSHLGYWQTTDDNWLLGDALSEDILARAHGYNRNLVREINKALKSTDIL